MRAYCNLKRGEWELYPKNPPRVPAVLCFYVLLRVHKHRHHAQVFCQNQESMGVGDLTDSIKKELSLSPAAVYGEKPSERRCFLWFLRELSNFHQLIPTQEGSMGWDDQTFLSLGQSRTANGLAFDFTKPLSRWASPGQAADRLSTSYVMSFVLSFAS